MRTRLGATLEGDEAAMIGLVRSRRTSSGLITAGREVSQVHLMGIIGTFGRLRKQLSCLWVDIGMELPKSYETVML